MNTKIILVLLGAATMPVAADAADFRCRPHPRPPCRIVVRPVCRPPVHYYRQPTAYYPRQTYSTASYGSSSYRYRSSSSSGGVSYRISTPFAYTPPPTNYGASGLGSVNYRVSTPFAYTSPSNYSSGGSNIGSFRIVQGGSQYVPHSNGGHYNRSIRLVPTR